MQAPKADFIFMATAAGNGVGHILKVSTHERVRARCMDGASSTHGRSLVDAWTKPRRCRTPLEASGEKGADCLANFIYLFIFVGHLITLSIHTETAMMQSMLRVAAMAALMGVALAGRSQTVVKGRLVDAENGEPLVGAQVRLTGEKTGVVTNAEGEFTLKNPARRREVTVSYSWVS